jgi:hypothetical protein
MKSIITAAALLLTFGLTSCKKDFTCECKKIRTDDNGNTISTVDNNYTFKDTRVKAEDKCQDQEGTGSDGLGDYTRECEIK